MSGDEYPDKESDINRAMNTRRSLVTSILQKTIGSIMANERSKELFIAEADYQWLDDGVDALIDDIPSLADDLEGFFGSSKEWDSNRQISCEMGYYFRDMKPFTWLSRPQFWNAATIGTHQDFIGTSVQYAVTMSMHAEIDWDSTHYLNPEGVNQLVEDAYELIFKPRENPYPIRMMMSTMEDMLPDMFDTDPSSIIVMGATSMEPGQFAEHVWQRFAKEMMKSMVEEMFDVAEDLPFAAENYYQEWVWDMFSGRLSWETELSWEQMSVWSNKDASLWDIVEFQVTNHLGRKMREVHENQLNRGEFSLRFGEDNS